MSQPPEYLQPSPARPATSLEYARPMPPVRVRQVLPRSLSMTLMICAAIMILSPCMTVALGTYAHGSFRMEDFQSAILVLTGLLGVLLMFFSISYSPRVPQSDR